MSSVSFNHFNKTLKCLWSKKIQVPALSHFKLLCESFHKQVHQEGNSGVLLNPSWHCVLSSTLAFQWVLFCGSSIGNNHQLLKSKTSFFFFFFSVRASCYHAFVYSLEFWLSCCIQSLLSKKVIVCACNDVALFHNVSQTDESSPVLRLHSAALHWEDFHAGQHHLVYSKQAVMNPQHLTGSTRASTKKILWHNSQTETKH